MHGSCEGERLAFDRIGWECLDGLCRGRRCYCACTLDQSAGLDLTSGRATLLSVDASGWTSMRLVRGGGCRSVSCAWPARLA